MPRKSPSPLPNRATVQLASTRKPQIALKTEGRQDGYDFTLQCGAKRWKGPNNKNRLKFLYDKDAAPFIQQMRTKDCIITYVPRGKKEPVEVTRVSHGFKEAFSYAEKYMRNPK